MSSFGFAAVEQGLRIARERAAYLAADAANAQTPGFVPHDVAVGPGSGGGAPFAAALREVQATGASGVLEYAMGATAKNAVTFRALSEQERSMLREFRIVAEEARR